MRDESHSAASVYDETHRGFAPDGAIIIRKSQHPTKPYYLQRVINGWADYRFYDVHALIGEEFATREEAEARAAQLV